MYRSHAVTSSSGSNDGSHEAQVALSALARALNISADVLKIALNGAFDLLQIAGGNPALALHLSLSRLGYRIDSSALHEIISNFRHGFSVLLNSPRAVTRCNTRIDLRAELEHWSPQYAAQVAHCNSIRRALDPASAVRTTTGPPDMRFGSHRGSESM